MLFIYMHIIKLIINETVIIPLLFYYSVNWLTSQANKKKTIIADSIRKYN